MDEFGDPVTDVFVTAMQYAYIQGGRRLTQSGRGGATNDIGEYRLYGLAPGQYLVSATLRNFNAMDSDNTDRSSYAATFYPGTGNVADAQRLTIAPGQTTSGINLTLLPIRTAKISGTALDADGKPMANAMINVMQRVGSTVIGNSATVVRADGKFTVNVTPGDYLLRAFGYSRGGGDGAGAEVTVNGSDIDNVQLVESKPSTIRGRIVFTESATGAPPPKPTSFELAAVREWVVGQQVRTQAKISEDGTFEMSLQPAHILIRGGIAVPSPVGPTGPSPWRLNRVLANGIDVGDTGIDVPASGTIENVVVEMTNRVSTASGRVTDAEGNTVRDCFVILFAQDAGTLDAADPLSQRLTSGAGRSVPCTAASRRLLRRGDERRRDRVRGPIPSSSPSLASMR